MKRRDFLKVALAFAMGGGFSTSAIAEVIKTASTEKKQDYDEQIKDYLYKIRNFDKPHENDFCLNRKKFNLLKTSVARMTALQQTVGHANFYLLNFDDALKIARSYSNVGRFTRAELDFLEMIFYEDGALYGFFGEKPMKNLTDRIQKREVVKIPRTGNYLYKGLPLETYRKIKRDIGDQVVLTSGVRSVIKQFFLFLNKAYKADGNLSLASRSLAPPGYSYHGVGDFDVGQAGFGKANFTLRFTTTDVYKKLKKLGYMDLRYCQNNFLGVRFEPWHIKITSHI